MNIQKEYELTINDYINFQKFSQKIQSEKQSYGQLIVFSLPAFYILFSIRFMGDDVVIWIGIIISLLFFIYYLLLNIFSGKKIFEKYLTKIYYKNFVSEKIKIVITEHSITETETFYERKILPQAVSNFRKNNDYIFLFNNKNSAIILPTKYFSDEEQEMIKKYYENNS